MKKIILANIGNRNLTYQGRTLLPDNRQPVPQSSFREQTLGLLTRYDTVNVELNEQILTVLLKDIGPENIEKVVLFASDNQISGDRNDQDTIHEAEILQRLFADRLSLSVEVIPYTQNVTHNDDLLRFYRDTLRPYQTNMSPIVICDAGGTAQQKAALKIAAEYLLDPTQFSVRYVLPSGQITSVSQVEYRRIIDEEQVAALVENGQYSGALYIYQQSVKPNQDALAILQFLVYRSELFYTDAQQLITASLKAKSPLLANFMGGRAIGNYDTFKEDFSAKAFRMLCERIEIAHFRYQLGDWSRTVLGLSIFIESWVNEAIQQQGDFKLVGEYDRASKELLSRVIGNPDYTYVLAYFGGANAIRTGLPLSLKYLEQTTETDQVREVVRLFLPLNSRTNQSEGRIGLDSLRNRLAHKGESVKESDLAKHAPNLPELISDVRKIIGLPEMNSYNTLNKLLISILRS